MRKRRKFDTFDRAKPRSLNRGKKRRSVSTLSLRPELRPKGIRRALGREVEWVDLYLEEQLRDPDFRGKFRKTGKAWDVAIQLASLRKKSGMSQKELAKRVRTSQQQISRLESPSYEGHSLSMLRRVADVLGATVHVEIQGQKQQPLPVVAEARPIYTVEGEVVGKRSELQKFEMDFLREGKINIVRNLRIVEALYKEAVTLGIIPLKNPLDGIEVDLKIAKVVNSV